MEFEWDAAKAERNRTKHGIDFDDALNAFFDPRRLERLSPRPHARELRILVIGMAGNEVLSVVYTLRGRVRRLISARRASYHERQAYHSPDR